MKIPAFIKQIAKCCDAGYSRYALGGVQCVADGTTAQLTATDGHLLVNVAYHDEGQPVSAIVEGKALAALPAKAFAHPKGVEFDGSVVRATVGPTKTETPVACVEGRFPRIEDVFTINACGDGYVTVKLDGALLSKLASVADAMGKERDTKGITLFVKDARSAVFASCVSDEGHVARMAIMPLVADDTTSHQFPPRPGETVNVTTGKAIAPAPVPEMMDAEQVAAAIAEPGDYDWAAPLPPL